MVYPLIKHTMIMLEHGRLFYIVGASGAGKDSLMLYARERLSDNKGVVFAHRYITRPVELGGENHIALSNAEFDSRLRNGCFAMHWHSHGLKYGIGIEINAWLVKGINVVLNGSRGYLEEASYLYPELSPVMIRVSLDKLEKRLLARGRENHADIQKRLQRARQFESFKHRNLQIITNDGDVDVAGDALAQHITCYTSELKSSCL